MRVKGIKAIRIVSITFIIVGVLCLLASGVFLWTSRRFVVSANKTEGTVIELVPGSRRGLFPKILYKDADGEEKTFTSTVSSQPPAYQVGEKVPLLYNKEKTKINSLWDLYFFSLLFGILGSIYAVVGAIGLIFWMIRENKTL